jgi:hypothetical protein
MQVASPFLDLPDKKIWAIYYEIIKKPQCIENIFVSEVAVSGWGELTDV